MVKQRLVACVNIFPIDSIYWWEGKIVSDKEVVLIAKTVKRNYRKVENFIKKRHSYKVPCVMGWEVERVKKEYEGWAVDSVRGVVTS